MFAINNDGTFDYNRCILSLRDLPVSAIIGFYMFVYSLMGPSIVDKIDTTAAIDALTKEVTNSIELKLRRMADPSALNSSNSSNSIDVIGDDYEFLSLGELPDGASSTPLKIQSAARAKLERVFERLHAIGTARSGLREFGSVTSTVAGSTVGMYSSLLDQLMARIFSPDQQQPLPADLMHVSEKAGGLLQKGLLWSRFASGANAARPTDARTILVFFVGGVSVKELNSVRLFVEKHKTHQFIVGSTRLFTSSSFVNEIIF